MIRILVVDPVDNSRRRVLAAVARHDAVSVVGVASTLADAVESCLTVRPEVVALTIHESGDEDVAIVRALMRERPTPIVLVCAGSRVRAREVAFEALKAGALDVVEMPDTTSLPSADPFSERLATALQLMADVRVVRQIVDRTGEFAPPEAGPSPAAVEAVGICSSTCGPAALDFILRRLPLDFPSPILIVQHISDGFLGGLVEWLKGTSKLEVRVATDGEIPTAGVVYFAPEQYHLRVGPMGALTFGSEPPIRSHRPAGEALFESMAERYGRRALGVMLTGMGDDGADGLAQIASMGGIVLAQDERTSVVYGMPRAVVERGVATEVLALEHMAERITFWAVEGPEGKRHP